MTISSDVGITIVFLAVLAVETVFYYLAGQ